MSHLPARGQSLIEYLLCVTVVVMALLLPMGDQPPALRQLADALTAALRGMTFLISIA